MSVKTRVSALLLLVLVVLVGGVSSASALAPCASCSPWWRLSSGARPAVLEAGAATDTVLKLTVSATKGDVFLANLKLRGETEGKEGSVVLPYNASAKVMQEALVKVYPSRTVEVSGGPGDEKGASAYVVTFPGQALLTNEVLFASGELAGSFPPGEELSCVGAVEPSSCTHQATVTQVGPEGRPDGQIVVLASNLGDAPAKAGGAAAISIADRLPAGLTAVSIEGVAGIGQGNERGPALCNLASLSCAFREGRFPGEEGTLPPFETIEVLVGVRVTGAVAQPNEAVVEGGGARTVAVRRAVRAGGAPATFGVENYALTLEEPGGGVDTQAGSHPFQATFALTLNQKLAHSTGQYQAPEEGPLALAAQPVELAKDLTTKLPAGLVGNPTVFLRCTTPQLTTEGSTCPQSAAVGVALVRFIFPHGPLAYEKVPVPLFNMQPNVGEPARFAFKIAGTTVYLDTSVRSGGDYGVTTTASNITQEIAFLGIEVTVWGVPGDSSHDISRGSGCIEASREEGPSTHPCKPSEEPHPDPLLSLPTSCTGPLQSSIEADSWVAPNERVTLASDPMPAMDGCDRLPFSPSISVTPDGLAGSSPTGLTVDAHVPQDLVLNPTGLAESNVRDITVKLPVGVAVNPASADGLEACSEGLVGFTGFGEVSTDPGVSNPLFSSYLPGSVGALAAGDEALLEPGKNFCPNASKVGEVTIHSPLLPSNQPLKGFVYLASQEANPFGSVLAMYIVVEDPVSGVLVKLAGEVQLCQGAGEVLAGMTCEGAGQLVSTFEGTPQLAFEDAELHFFGGERAPLTSPSRCGTYTTEAAFVPWSGNAPARSSSSFNITSGPNHTPCVYPGQALPFNPTLTGGATNIQAGAFSPFTLTMSRLPGEQNLQSVEAHLPPGLSGILSNIELCPEPQANQGSCAPNSLIGETTVSVGVGGSPFSVKGGKFFLTGPYNGTGGCTVGSAGCAPFGITFEVPAKAGPFDFAKTARNHPACDCVLVRGKIEIDPHTAAITITSNPPGTPDSIPTQLEGIPLEIQHVNAITTRSNFQFNPTNCNKMAVTGTIHSSEGGVDTINVPFQVTNCATLKFAPKFQVSTSGKTSKAKGASLHVKLTYPKTPFGTQANITRVKVDLPKQLPSQLKTLQKACTATQFELNPANCPAASKVGYAKAITPLIPVPLEGPAIFVSHGNEAFPTLTMVLQGYGVTIDLVGSTFISKAGITSSTFKAVPDQPIGSFELTLPQGKYSALAANGNLCKTKLAMPTEFLAQNGAKINQTTKISVTGCAKHARHTGKKKYHHQRKRKT